MIYPPDLVSSLISHHELYPNSAIGSSGMLLRYNCPMCAITPNEDNFVYRIPKFAIPPQGRKVDSIYGYPGALYLRKFFPSGGIAELEEKFLRYALIDDNMYINDDIVISGYLSLVQIDRRIFTGIPSVSFVVSDETGARVRNENEISYDLSKFFRRMNAAIITSKSLDMYNTTEPVDISETIAGVSAIVIFSAIIVIILIAYIFMSPGLRLPPFFI